MNEDTFGKEIAKTLNTGLNDLKPSVAARLADVRAAALTKQKQPVSVLSFAGVAGSMGKFLDRETRNFRQFALGALLVLGAVGYTYVQSTAYVDSLVDVDSQLLSDELPLDVYMDTNLRDWLMDNSSDSEENLE